MESNTNFSNKITYQIDDQLEIVKPSLKEILNLNNLPPVLILMNSLLPREAVRLRKDAYETAIAAAKYDAVIEFINAFTSKVNEIRLK